MKVSNYTFRNLYFPLLHLDNGSRFGLTNGLAHALGIDPHALRTVFKRHEDEFDSNCATDCDAIEFLKENKVQFGLKYVRGDMRLWSLHDMILMALLSRTSVSKEFRRDIISYVEENAHEEIVAIGMERDEAVRKYNALIEETRGMHGRLENLEELVARMQPATQAVASAAGAVLSAQKGMLRVVK